LHPVPYSSELLHHQNSICPVRCGESHYSKAERMQQDTPYLFTKDLQDWIAFKEK
jgi:hypothetical protein